MALGQRGYSVALAEGTRELGGRVLRESALPGLAEWIRVVDYRIGQLEKLPNVEVYRESLLDAEQILEFGSDHVVLAAGSSWRRTGEGHWHTSPIEGAESARIYTPDDLMTGNIPKGPVLLFDDDHYYMGGLLAEKLRALEIDVTLVTPESKASLYTENTEEHPRIQARLIEIGVELELNTGLDSLSDGYASLACAYTEETREIKADEIVLVTSREPNDGLYRTLSRKISITRIGDCLGSEHHRGSRLLWTSICTRVRRTSAYQRTVQERTGWPLLEMGRPVHPRRSSRQERDPQQRLENGRLK